MKVRCVTVCDIHGGQVEESAWLTIGKIYHVLEIVVRDSDGVWFRIVTDDNGSPGLHRARQFERITGNIPSCWVVSYEPHSSLILSPETWLENLFWTRYFDGDQDAQKEFERVFQIIVAEDP
jgi:hypothetical protein